MKIIKSGSWKSRWSGNFICKTCSAELLVEEEDLRPDNSKTDYNFYICIECNHINYIDFSELTLRVREELNIRRKYRSSGEK